MRVVFQPLMVSRSARTVAPQLDDLADLKPPPNPMLRCSDETPTAVMLNWTKQSKKNEQVAGSNVLIIEMTLRS